MKIDYLRNKFLPGVLLFVLCMISTDAYSQKINAEIAVIIDTRVSNRIENSETASLTLQIEFTGIEMGTNNYLKPGRITKAVDNLGNNFQLDETAYDTYGYNTILNYRLFSTERTATEIAVLEGTVKHFDPTEANNGIINVDRPLDKLGANVLNGKSSDAVVVLLDRKKLQKLKNENERAYKQELEKLKKVYGNGGGSIAELDELLDDTGFGEENELFCFYYDPEVSIIDISVFNSDGKSLVYGNSERGNHIAFSLYESLSDSTKIRLYLENPQSVKEYPFKLEKIKLP